MNSLPFLPLPGRYIPADEVAKLITNTVRVPLLVITPIAAPVRDVAMATAP